MIERPQVSAKTIIPAAETTLGLDYSSHDFYVDSNGNKADYPRYYRKAEKRLKCQQCKLSHKKLGSNNRNKQRMKVAAIHEKTANQRKDFCHKLSRKIANSYDAVCVEDINLHGLAGSLELGKSTNDNGFGMFRTFLKYKMEDQGKLLIVIDKWYPSSKMCHECGTINQNLKLKDREWTCSCCGAHIDRDINAAKNIRDVGLKQYFEQINAA